MVRPPAACWTHAHHGAATGCMLGAAFAWSGMMSLIREEASPPLYLSPGAAEQLVATTLTWGVIGALYCRERTGEDQQVEASLLGHWSTF